MEMDEGIPEPPVASLPEAELRATVLRCKRSPVMILLAAMAAQRAHRVDFECALGIGRCVADVFAKRKAEVNGMRPWTHHGDGSAMRGTAQVIRLFGIDVRVRLVPGSIPGDVLKGAAFYDASDEEISSAKVAKYLKASLAGELSVLRQALALLLSAMGVDDITDDHVLYGIWERIRPHVPKGRAGWGAVGNMPLAAVVEERDRYLSHGESAAEQQSDGE